MVRLRIRQIMKARHISAYALSKGTNIGYPSAYQPGKLLQWVP